MTTAAGNASLDSSGRASVDSERPSVGELIADVSKDFTTLMRQEVELAKAEVRQSATSAGKGAGMLAGAGIGAHFVLLFISLAAWWGLAHKMDIAWAAVVVAVIWAIIAAVLALMGRKELKSVTGVPRTTETVKKIPSAAKGNEELS